MGIKKFVNKQLFCLIGLPLSGKSHVGKLLASRIHNAVYISTGDISRELIKTEDEVALMVQRDLFPGEDALRQAVREKIESTAATCVILDGFPRFDEQADYLAATFDHLFPIVIEITTADLPTLALRAKMRARDSRDTDQIQFAQRLELAMKNQADTIAVLNKRLIRTYTIISTADEASILKQFHQITKQRP